MAPWTSAALAFAACACSLPLAVRAGKQWGIYDQPGELKIHRSPVPRVGGIAMMAGVCAAMALGWRSGTEVSPWIVVAVSGVWVAGLWDDVRPLPPLVRLMIQLGAGAMVWGAGWRLHWLPWGLLDLPVTALFVAFVINAMNMFDGMDGLAASWAALAGTGFAMVSGGSFSRTLAGGVAGICAGVLLSNFPPAKIFMGDSGSTLLGVLLGILSLDWVRTQPETHRIGTALLLLSLPLTDALLAVLRRVISLRSPFLGDRRHFYDLLLQRGWPVQKTLIFLLSVTIVTIGAGVYSAGHPNALLCSAGVAGVLLLAPAYLLGSFSSQADNPVQPGIASVESIGMTTESTTHS